MNPSIQALEQRLAILERQHVQFSKEIEILRDAIDRLKMADEAASEAIADAKPVPEMPIFEGFSDIPKKEPTAPPRKEPTAPPSFAPPQRPKPPRKPAPAPINLEKFIGENLINKIGIGITVIGVGIGAKYSIEHDLISPLTRIVLGYLAGIALLAFGMKLKERYEQYSAVLVSGAMAIMYFITYAGYSFYDLMPQMAAFALMLLFTGFTVVAALKYDKSVIAHIGLVGAYAVPILLSDGSGRVLILFSYMAIINVGILVLSFYKYWKSLYYASFALTWLIFLGWFADKYDPTIHFGLTFAFVGLFFSIFYITFIAYKLRKGEAFDKGDAALLLCNTFIFYGVGYKLLEDQVFGNQLLGLFTLANAVIHFVVGNMVHRQRLADPKLLYLVIGLVMVFITIAVPVQLDGNWVTLLWGTQAALLFWLGRTKQIGIYEQLSYPIMALAFLSLLHDWGTVYQDYSPEMAEKYIFPIFNIHFLTSLMVAASFGFINWLYQQPQHASALKKVGKEMADFLLPAALLVVAYFSVFMEIANYWEHLFGASSLEVLVEDGGYTTTFRDYDLQKFKDIWLINYTLLFFAGLSLFNIFWLKSTHLANANLIFNTLAVGVFLIAGLFTLDELRESYMGSDLSAYYERGNMYWIVRYLSLACLALLVGASYLYSKNLIFSKNYKKPFWLAFHLTMLWTASAELVYWLEIGGSTQSHKLGLSILWGSYALLLISLGIWRKIQYLRVAAISLFAVTLFKLFFYDISHLDTIAKTVVFVSLGVLLLIISFLYNKYKHLIADENAAE